MKKYASKGHPRRSAIMLRKESRFFKPDFIRETPPKKAM